LPALWVQYICLEGITGTASGKNDDDCDDEDDDEDDKEEEEKKTDGAKVGGVCGIGFGRFGWYSWDLHSASLPSRLMTGETVLTLL
jgi:hypothetical protein